VTPAPAKARGWFVLTFALIAFVGAQSRAQEHEVAKPIAVVRDLYAAFTRGDLDHIGTLLAPDTVWTFHGPEHLIPYAGIYKGPRGVAEFFAAIGATIDVREIVQSQFVEDGDTIAVTGWERSVARETGGEFVAHWVHVWQVKRGLITRFEEFTDSAAIVAALAPADPARGKAYFTTCAGCHGPAAQGNAGMHAPNLTVQGGAYLLRQLRHFAHDVRGGPQDFYGWQMNGRAKALPDDRALRDVVSYIDTLPKVQAGPTLRANATAGKALYASCASCHGDRGTGNATVDGPALAGLDDWYLLAQLNAYRSGQRGHHKDDTQGAQMRSAALVLQSDEAVRDVVAYIASVH
jgi:cytochrome c553